LRQKCEGDFVIIILDRLSIIYAGEKVTKIWEIEREKDDDGWIQRQTENETVRVSIS